MNLAGKKILAYKIIAMLVFAIVYILSMARLGSFNNDDDISSSTIFIYSWLGIIVFMVYLIWWKKLTGKSLSPFTIFLLFVTLFNFGQCFLWAFGIHSDTEIGKKLVFSSVSANNALILKMQILYIVSYVAINTGAILVYKRTERNTSVMALDIGNRGGGKYRALFVASVIAATYAIPVMLYVTIKKCIYTQIYSYHDIYYGSIANAFDSPFFAVGCSLFFVSLIGLLIGSRYRKGVRYFVYVIFAFYSAVSLIGGDRGEWVMPLMFLFWMHISLCKPMRRRTALFLGLGAFLSLYLMNAIVSLRNVGLSYDKFVEALVSGDGVIKPLLTEFGQTMGIGIILLAKNTVSLYGNTYLMSIPTIFGTGLANRMFGMNYVQLHTWFPLEYLGISYGTDFSIIGEAMLNCGVVATPIAMILGGLLIGRIFNYPLRKDINPLMLCLALNAMIGVIGIARSTLWITLNKIALSSAAFVSVYFIVKLILRNSSTARLANDTIAEDKL